MSRKNIFAALQEPKKSKKSSQVQVSDEADEAGHRPGVRVPIWSLD